MSNHHRFHLFAKPSFCNYYLARQIYLYTQGLSTIWILKTILMSPNPQRIFWLSLRTDQAIEDGI
jgi:hypothetical protein